MILLVPPALVKVFQALVIRIRGHCTSEALLGGVGEELLPLASDPHWLRIARSMSVFVSSILSGRDGCQPAFKGPLSPCYSSVAMTVYCRIRRPSNTQMVFYLAASVGFRYSAVTRRSKYFLHGIIWQNSFLHDFLLCYVDRISLRTSREQ